MFLLVIVRCFLHASAVTVTFSLVVKSNFTWDLRLRGLTVDMGRHSLPLFVPSVSDLNTVISFANGYTICPGNSDEKYSMLAKARKRKFMTCHHSSVQ
jgi:hypothetical protein